MPPIGQMRRRERQRGCGRPLLPSPCHQFAAGGHRCLLGGPLGLRCKVHRGGRLDAAGPGRSPALTGSGDLGGPGGVVGTAVSAGSIDGGGKMNAAMPRKLCDGVNALGRLVDVAEADNPLTQLRVVRAPNSKTGASPRTASRAAQARRPTASPQLPHKAFGPPGPCNGNGTAHDAVSGRSGLLCRRVKLARPGLGDRWQESKPGKPKPLPSQVRLSRASKK